MPLRRHAGPALLLLLAATACASRYAPTNAPQPCTADQLKRDYANYRSAAELRWDRAIAQATTPLERERLSNRRSYELGRVYRDYDRRIRNAMRADSLSGCTHTP